jgi:hypothetical protein
MGRINERKALILYLCNVYVPISVAAGSEARHIFARSNSIAVGSNPTEAMDVCGVYFVLMLICEQAEALCRDDPPSRES